MSWLLVVAAAWTVLALPAGLVVGRSIRKVDQGTTVARHPSVPDFIPIEVLASVAAADRGAR